MPIPRARRCALPHRTKVFVTGDSNLQGLGLALSWYLSASSKAVRVKTLTDICVSSSIQGSLARHYDKTLDARLKQWPRPNTPEATDPSAYCKVRARARRVADQLRPVVSGPPKEERNAARGVIDCTGARAKTYQPLSRWHTPPDAPGRHAASTCKDCDRCLSRHASHDLGPCAYQRDLKALSGFIARALGCLSAYIFWVEMPDKPPSVKHRLRQERIAQPLLKRMLPSVRTIKWPHTCDEAWAYPSPTDLDRHLCFHSHVMQRLVHNVVHEIARDEKT